MAQSAHTKPRLSSDAGLYLTISEFIVYGEHAVPQGCLTCSPENSAQVAVRVPGMRTTRVFDQFGVFAQVLSLEDVEGLLGPRPFKSEELRNIDRYRKGLQAGESSSVSATEESSSQATQSADNQDTGPSATGGVEGAEVAAEAAPEPTGQPKDADGSKLSSDGGREEGPDEVSKSANEHRKLPGSDRRTVAS